MAMDILNYYDFGVYPRYVDGYVDKNSYIHEVAIKLRCVW